MAGRYTSALALEDMIWEVFFIRSTSAMEDTSDVSLMTMINSLPTGGISRRTDWGMMMSRIVCQ